MPARLFVTIQGLEPVKRKLRNPELYGAALRSWLGKTARLVKEEARKRAPMDTGELRDSIEVEGTTFGQRPGFYELNVIASAPHARFVHGGFGRRRRQRTQPHWPPIEAVAGWAVRHGLPPFVVARAIASRGTPFVPFMREGVEANRNRIEIVFTEQASADIERAWNRL